jgi:hypothetical protein
MGTEFFLGKWQEAGGVSGIEARISAGRFTTHGAVIGMTGSGKTGLLVGLLEEAALAGVPSLVIDPKGDLTNRLLVFPEARPEDFSPFCSASRAEETSARWREGLALWGLGPDRARELRSRPIRVFTPGATLAPVNVLERFAPPAGGASEFSSRAGAAAASLFNLAGLDGDPTTSPEGLLLAQIFLDFWTRGKALALEDLVRATLQPPFSKIGILDLDTVLPPKERTALAMRLNALLASPSLAAWRSGPALDMEALLGSGAAPGSQAVFTLAHLGEGERLFFLGLLLEEVAAWTLRQGGSDSLRALVLFDEVFGFFPPHPGNPPTKAPLLRLLKQARAFGVGVVLASQNPVDLDYKGLTNAGLWFVGRLQTENDRRRLADGMGNLPGGAEATALLEDLPQRTFLVHDVREDHPRLLKTRQCFSYLAGPLTVPQLEKLLGPVPAAPASVAPQASAGMASGPAPAPSTVAPSGPPALPPTWTAAYSGSGLLIPHLDVEAEIAYKTGPRATPVLSRTRYAWPLGATSLEAALAADPKVLTNPAGSPEAPTGATFSPLPHYLGRTGPDKAAKAAVSSLSRRVSLRLLKDGATGAMQAPDEAEAAFRARIIPAREEARRAEEDKALGALSKKFQLLEDRVRKFEMEVEQGQADASARSTETMISAGLGVLGGLFGSKRSIGGAVSRTISKQRMASRAKGEVAEDRATLEAARRDRDALKRQMDETRAELSRKYGSPDLEAVTLSPSATGVQILTCRILFAPSP